MAGFPGLVLLRQVAVDEMHTDATLQGSLDNVTQVHLVVVRTRSRLVDEILDEFVVARIPSDVDSFVEAILFVAGALKEQVGDKASLDEPLDELSWPTVGMDLADAQRADSQQSFRINTRHHIELSVDAQLLILGDTLTDHGSHGILLDYLTR